MEMADEEDEAESKKKPYDNASIRKCSSNCINYSMHCWTVLYSSAGQISDLVKLQTLLWRYPKVPRDDIKLRSSKNLPAWLALKVDGGIASCLYSAVNDQGG